MPHCTFIAVRRACRPPPTGGAVGQAAARQGGGRLPPGAKMRLNINFIYIEVPTARPEGGRGPAAPQLGSRITKL